MTRSRRPSLRALAVPALLALAAPLIGASPLAAQGDFQWRGRLAAGQTIEVKGVNGGIRATAAAGDEVEVVAVRSARRSDVASVTFDVVEHAGGVTICAVYPDHDLDRPNVCAPGDGGRMNTRNNDVNVEFTVRVPRGVALAARTVNGGIEATALQSDVDAATVNGRIRVGTTGLARARTVNGSIDASLGSAAWSDRLDFETVNGSITLEMPASLSARVEAATVNGAIETDFPLQVQGRFSSRRIRGIVGSGGRDLAVKTVNGEIRLRRGT